jgi:hypothetical protein
MPEMQLGFTDVIAAKAAVYSGTPCGMVSPNKRHVAHPFVRKMRQQKKKLFSAFAGMIKAAG